MARWINLIRVNEENLQAILEDPTLVEEVLFGEEDEIGGLNNFDWEHDSWADEYEWYEMTFKEWAEENNLTIMELLRTEEIRKEPLYQSIYGTVKIPDSFIQVDDCFYNSSETVKKLSEVLSKRHEDDEDEPRSLEDLSEDDAEGYTLDEFYRLAASKNQSIICVMTED